MELVELAGEADHRAAAERDDDRAGAEAVDAAPADPVERRLALEEAELDLRERVPDERQRLGGAISAVQQMIGAPGLTRSSPVTRPTRSSPSSAERRWWASCASMRSGAAYTPRPVSTRNRSASCVLPEFVGPRCAITVSGSAWRSGRRTVSSETGRRAGVCRRRWRSLRLGRFCRWFLPRATGRR